MNLDRFKFRVWYPKYKDLEGNEFGKMVYLEDESFGYDLPAICEEVKQENCFLMQSTGLKDKNGKLVFIGDIMRYDLYSHYSEEELEDVKPSRRYCTFEIVEALNGWWIDVIEDNGTPNNTYANTFDQYFSEQFFECDERTHPILECEVIGNRFENPKLLND